MTPLSEYLARLAALRRLLKCEWWDIRVCVSQDLHRREWYRYADQHYYCAICERIKVA